MQREIKNAHIPEQELTGTPSAEYILATHRAILWTCKREWPNDYLELKKKFDHIDRLLLGDAKKKEIKDTQSEASSTQPDDINC